MTQENRLASLKAFQTIKNKIESATKALEDLEVSEAKRKKEEELEAAKVAANEKRKEDQRAKVLWGAGLQLLEPGEAACTRAKILKVLSDRDREWMTKYTAKHEIALSDAEPAKAELRPEDTTPPLLKPTAPIANVLLRVLEQLDPSFLSLVEGEFLSRSQGEERGILEVYFAKLGER